MNITSKLNEDVPLTVKKSDLGELGMLMDWIIDNYKTMDKGMISLNENEILPTVRKWSNIIHSNI